MEQVEIHLMEIWNGLKVATNVYLSSNLNKKKMKILVKICLMTSAGIQWNKEEKWRCQKWMV